MLEQIIKKKNFRILIYIFGALLEIVGFSLLFAFDKSMRLAHSYPILFSIILIISGYLLAVGVRRK